MIRAASRAGVGPAMLLLLSVAAAPAVVSAGPWIAANPGAGGAFTSIGAGPTGVILCGSDLGGAYRSLDHGQTWNAIGPAQGMDAAHVSAVGFDPQNASIMYLGSEWGLFRSSNGGTSFQKVTASNYIAAIAVAPSSPTTVYAAYHPTYDATTSGLFRSTDRGVNWTNLSTNLPSNLRITKLVAHPTNPSILYMVSGIDLFIANALPSLWKSLDAGATWIRLGPNLGNVWDFAIDPLTPQTVYATVYTGTPRSSWSGSTYKSTDGGVTWTQKGSHTGCVLVKRDQPQTVWVIDPDRDDGDSEQGVWQSVNGGDSWSRKSTMSNWDSGWQAANWAYGGSGYGMAKVMGQDLSDPNVIFWTHWQFVFGTSDGGGRFANLFTNEVSPGWWITRGIENVAVVGVAISEANPNQMYAGYYDLGLWRSLDGGQSWQTANHPSFTGAWNGHGGCAVSIVPDPSRANTVFAIMGEEADLATVVKSTREGEQSSWTAANSGLPSGFVYGLSMSKTSPSTQRTLFVTSAGDVYRSTNDGASWTSVFDCNTCRVTAVDPQNGNLVYAGGEGGLWRSTSGGASGSWTQVGPSALSGSVSGELKEVQWTGIHAITPDPRNVGRVYVAAFGSGKGVYRSNDLGSTWSQIKSGDYFRGVAVSPSNASDVFITSSKAYKAGGTPGGSEGILRSQDGGATWSSIQDAIPWPYAGPIAIDPVNPSKIIVGSPGTGFWIRYLDSQVVDTVPPGPIRDVQAR
jgi:sortilin (neurotensin receptor 3)